MKDFAYCAPSTLREAVALKAEKGEAARVLAGGTDLIVQLRGNRFAPDCIIDIKNVPEANELSYGPRRGLVIGAGVSCWRIYNDPEIVERYPGLIDSAAIIGGIQIQGRATFGGNLCNASPSADTIPSLITHSAVCHIAGPDGKRQVAVEDFCTAPGRSVLAPGEILGCSPASDCEEEHGLSLPALHSAQRDGHRRRRGVLPRHLGQSRQGV